MLFALSLWPFLVHHMKPAKTSKNHGTLTSAAASWLHFSQSPHLFSPKHPAHAPSAAAPSNPYSSTPFVPYSPPQIVRNDVNKISQYRWGPSLCPNQEYALSFIFDNTAAGWKVLLINRTCGSKSHVMRCTGDTASY